VRWISAEPLLGPVDLRLTVAVNEDCRGCSGLLSPAHEPGNHWDPGEWHGLDWVVVVGESGPGARPMHPDWARTLRDQCAAIGVPYFFKQWGEHGQDGRRVGRRAAGDLLDGRQHHEWPVSQ
jgi:protein gp37